MPRHSLEGKSPYIRQLPSEVLTEAMLHIFRVASEYRYQLERYEKSPTPRQLDRCSVARNDLLGTIQAYDEELDIRGWTEFFRNRPLVLRRQPQCGNCGSTSNLQVDHIIPSSCGGSSELSNLQTLCRTCNASKCAWTQEDWEASGNAARLRREVAATLE